MPIPIYYLPNMSALLIIYNFFFFFVQYINGIELLLIRIVQIISVFKYKFIKLNDLKITDIDRAC